jgi:hypothetical protein
MSRIAMRAKKMGAGWGTTRRPFLPRAPGGKAISETEKDTYLAPLGKDSLHRGRESFTGVGRAVRYESCGGLDEI